MAGGRSHTAAAPAPGAGRTIVVPPLDASSDDMIEGVCILYRTLGEDFNKTPLAIAGLGNMSRRRVRAQYELALHNARRAGITCIERFNQPDLDEPMEIDF